MQIPEEKTIENLIQITIDATSELKNGHDFDEMDITKLLDDINESIYKQDDLIQMQILKNALDTLFGELKIQEKDMFKRLTTHNSRKIAHTAYASSSKR